MKYFVRLIAGIWLLLTICSCSDNQTMMSMSEISYPADSIIPLRFNSEKNFRILQLSDLHIDQSHFEPIIKENIKKLILYSEPDLVVLTGDIVTGQPATYQWLLFATYMQRIETPYLITLGNHDSQYYLTRDKLYEMLHTFPNCQNRFYEDAFSYMRGDMVIPIAKNDNSGTGALLYLFDTNDFSKTNEELGIRPQQTSWFEEKSPTVLTDEEKKTVPALVFMHVPLREYKENSQKPGAMIAGQRGEPEYYAINSNGFFEALQNAENICGVFCGHDHFNDYVIRAGDIALCYARKSGSRNTYQLYPTGARIIDLHENEMGFSTSILEVDRSQHHACHFSKSENTAK